MVHPSLDIGKASVWGRNYLMKLTEMGWGIKLIVIREAVMKEQMVIDNSREVEYKVQNEDNQSKSWPLKDNKLENSWKRFRAIDRNY